MSTAEQRTRRRQAREETRGQILDAAVRSLRERPYRDLSVDALMGATGHTRTVFYRHFDDMADLVLAVLQEVGNELWETSQRWAGAAGDGEAAMREGLSAIVDFFARQGPLLRAVTEAAQHDDEIERIYSGFMQMFTEMTERALAEQLAAGKVADIDPVETARALTLMNERYLLDSFGREPIADRDKVLASLQTIWGRVLYGSGS